MLEFRLCRSCAGRLKPLFSLATILEELGVKIMSVNKEGVRMIAAKGATCGDLSTSLSASSSNTGQEADESTFPDAQDDGDDGVCL